MPRERGAVHAEFDGHGDFFTMNSTTRKPSSYLAALREAHEKRPDFGRVMRLLEKALNAGSPDASYALGTWYLLGHHVPQDERRAFQLLRRAARANVADAAMYVAICYERGIGTRASPGRAFEHYVQAALHGETSALFEVGRCLYYGIGVPRSRRLASLWFDRAQELGVRYESKQQSASGPAQERARPRLDPQSAEHVAGPSLRSRAAFRAPPRTRARRTP